MFFKGKHGRSLSKKLSQGEKGNFISPTYKPPIGPCICFTSLAEPPQGCRRTLTAGGEGPSELGSSMILLKLYHLPFLHVEAVTAPRS